MGSFTWPIYERSHLLKAAVDCRIPRLGMAVRVRFELTEPVKVQRFSRQPDSTALAPLRLASLTILAKNVAHRYFAAGESASRNPTYAGFG